MFIYSLCLNVMVLMYIVLQIFKTDSSMPEKKPRSGSAGVFEELVLILFLLITWLWENQKFFPEFYYMYMLGDNYGWVTTMTLTKNSQLLNFSLESCHRVTTQLIQKSRQPKTWNQSLPFKIFMWFKYLYLNRHCVPPKLAKKPFYSILSKF